MGNFFIFWIIKFSLLALHTSLEDFCGSLRCCKLKSNAITLTEKDQKLYKIFHKLNYKFLKIFNFLFSISSNFKALRHYV